MNAQQVVAVTPGVNLISSLELRSFSCSWSPGSRPVVSGVSVVFDAGQVTAICGPNGCGKSSLVGCLAGLSEPVPTSGKAIWHSCKEDGLWESKQARAHSVLLRQAAPFVPSDYVSSYFALFANAKYGGKDLLPEMCKRFSVDGLLSKRLSELSGGQWRRVQCAAHFSVQAPVRFLDEPETGLDLDAVEELVRQIRGARSRGEIVVLTTHNEPFLAATANQVVYLKDGVCQWVSSKPMFAEYGPRLSLG